jgi:GT2 family glycosyltransferase
MWYKKYMQAFECPYEEISPKIVDNLKQLIAARKTDEPLASVVLIAHNEERHLIGCLWSLCDNVCNFPIELIVVSNHSTDATEELLNRIGITWYDEPKKGPGFARQCGLNHARGKYHLCIDADTLYPPHYIATHVKWLEKKNVVQTYSLWSFIPDATHSRRGLFFLELFRDAYFLLLNIKRPELCVRGMVSSVRTEYARQIGYRTEILRGEDGSMALALKKYGKLKFILSRKARAVTSSGTLVKGGTLAQSFWLRTKKAVRSITLLFTKQEKYENRDYNLLPPEKED